MTAFRLFRQATSSDTDAELLRRFVIDHNESAFAELLNRHGPLVYRVCRRILDASRADDAFQATFLVLATRASRVRKAASVGSWLIGVAGRVAWQVRRKCLAAPASEPVENLTGSEAAATRHLETADLGRVLDEELTRLPDNLRAVVVACLVEERTQAEAAVALGESERTVRRRVAEARQLLRERLERRGVVPAVVVGLVASIGTATAVPLRLTDNTLSVVFDFLAGGAAVASAPAILANGVAMTGFRKTLAASLAAVALGLTALGVGLADDKPKPNAKAEQTIPPQNVPLGDKDPVPPPRPAPLTPPLFVVSGGDELANRVVQREAEFVARTVAERWGVQPLPQLKEKWRIVLKIEPARTGGASTFTFEQEPKRGVRSMEMQLIGNLENILRTQLPHEITHCVLAAHFGRPVPRWIDEGIAVLSESGKEQVDHDRRLRELVNAGRCLTLKKLLPMTEYPRDMIVLYAQGHSLSRFLHERDAKKLFPLIEASFADGWDKALKATYGFKDADALEEAWLAWLKKPDSVLKAEKLTETKAEYIVEPADILHITFAPKLDGLSADGEYLVRPDGTVLLGKYGAATVAGLTLRDAMGAVQKAVSGKFDEPALSLAIDVTAFNRKFYYVITDFAGNGEQVQRRPITGNETVLDSLSSLGGLSKIGKRKVWLMRPGSDNGKHQILPVDWSGITKDGETKTNYQILPGDRLHILSEK